MVIKMSKISNIILPEGVISFWTGLVPLETQIFLIYAFGRLYLIHYVVFNAVSSNLDRVLQKQPFADVLQNMCS